MYVHSQLLNCDEDAVCCGLDFRKGWTRGLRKEFGGRERLPENNLNGALAEKKVAPSHLEYPFDSDGNNGRARAVGEVRNSAARFRADRAVSRLSSFGKDADAASSVEYFNVRFERLFVVLRPGMDGVRTPQLKKETAVEKLSPAARSVKCLLARSVEERH